MSTRRRLLLIVLVPCLLLLPYMGNFYADWANHLWLLGYYGAYFRAHHEVPVVLNTPVLVGFAFPVFYGFLFYPILGAFTAYVSADLVLRFCVVALFVSQAWLVFHVVRQRAPDAVALKIAAIVTWAIYPLTNLYNRGAIPEFVAIMLAGDAAMTWVLSLTEPRRRARVMWVGTTVALLTLTAGCHPLTGAYAALFFTAISILAFGVTERRVVYVEYLLFAIAALAVLSPWMYAMQHWGGHLAIARTPKLEHFTDSIDAPWARFFPLPLDARTWATPQVLRTWLFPDRAISTPYLDAQVSVPLMLVCAAGSLVVSRSRLRVPWSARAFFGGVAVLFAFTAWLSLSPGANALPALFRLAQFGYRFVAYQNLALLVFVAGGLLLVPAVEEIARSPRFSTIVHVAFCLALCAVVVKLYHAASKFRPDWSVTIVSTSGRRSVAAPAGFYAYDDYATPDAWPNVETRLERNAPDVEIPVDAGGDFGAPREIAVTVPAPKWMTTNVSPFPWNRLVIDGRELATEDIRVALTADRRYPRPEKFLAFSAPSGAHRLAIRTTPDRRWLMLRRISWAVALCWALGLAWLAIGRRPSAGTG